MTGQYNAKTLVVASGVKNLCKHNKKYLNMAKNLPEALTEKVKTILEKASERAILNGRTTVMDKDL